MSASPEVFPTHVPQLGEIEVAEQSLGLAQEGVERVEIELRKIAKENFPVEMSPAEAWHLTAFAANVEHDANGLIRLAASIRTHVEVIMGAQDERALTGGGADA